MPNKKKKSSKKHKQQHRPPGNHTSGLPPQAAGSASGGPSTTTTTTAVTYKCLRFPVDGSSPERLDYTTITPLPKCYDSYLDIAADLRAYWHGDYLAHKIQNLVVEGQSPATLNGEYIIYYSIDPSMPANKTLLSMPAVRDAVERSTNSGERFEGRLFYRGDVFVVRLGDTFENTNFEAKYDDISPQLVQPLTQILAEIFENNWERKFLETQRRNDAYFDESLGKYRDYKGKLMAEL